VAGTNVIESAALAVTENVTHDALTANEAVAGINVMESAALADIANPENEDESAEDATRAKLAVIAYEDDGDSISGAQEALTANEAVSGTKVIESAALAVTANTAHDDERAKSAYDALIALGLSGAQDADTAKDAVAGVNVIDVAVLAVTANEAVSAKDALVDVPLPGAQLAETAKDDESA